VSPTEPNEPKLPSLPPSAQVNSAWANGDSLALGEQFSQVVAQGTGSFAEPPSIMINGIAILGALRQRWVPALLLGVIFAATGAISASALFPEKYTARTRFHVAARTPSILFPTLETSSDLSSYQRTQVELIKSQLVLDVVLKRPEVAALPSVLLQTEPVQWIEQQLLCEFPAPEILRLSLSGKDPLELETLLSAIADAYLNQVVNKEKNERLSKLSRLSEISKKWEDDLSTKKGAYRERAKEAGSSDPQTLAFAHRLALDQLAGVKSDLLQSQHEIRKLEAELRIREKQGSDNVQPAVVILEEEIKERIRQNSEVSRLLAQRVELEKAKSRAQGRYGQYHPSVKNYSEELEFNRAAVSAKERELRPSIVKQLTSEQRGLPKSLSQLRENIAILKEYQLKLQADVNRLADETKDINRSSLDLDTLRDTITRTGEIAKAVGTQAESIRLELDAPSRVTVLEKPTVSHTVDGKKRMLVIAGAAVGGWALAFVGVLGWELRARKVVDANQVSQATRIRVIGTLPVWSYKGQGCERSLQNVSAAADYSRDLMTESVDRARLKLLSASRQEPIRIILITSAISGEGKTSLASHLAVSLARAGRRTLLIDADLRRPALHKLFDVCLEPGFSAVLREELSATDAIRPTYVRGLEILPAGCGDIGAIRSLGNERVRGIFEQLAQAYDFILVDSAPVLAVVDAPLIAQYVDGVLFSVMCGISHLPSLYQCQQEIAHLGVRILGAVVSGTRGSTGGYGYSSSAYSADYTRPDIGA